MEINITLGNSIYQGTAVPYEKTGPAETHFVVRLKGKPVFHLYMSDKGDWASNDTDDLSLVRAIGEAIRTQDDHAVEIVENGEIINEPEDVEERSFKI
jgi:hypothetical protein